MALLLIFIFRKRLFSKNKIFWTSLTVFLVLYLFIVGGVTYYDIYHQWDLNRYDLDKDGMFGGKEITAKQKEAMRNLTNDTGRNLSFISGFIFSFIIAAVVYILGMLIVKLKRR